MGGGKKRKSITQMTKSQNTETSRKERKGKSTGTTRSSTKDGIRSLKIVSPNPSDKRISQEVKSMTVLTPYTVANKFNISLSAAKKLLNKMYKKGDITYVSGSRNIRIFKPTQQPPHSNS